MTIPSGITEWRSRSGSLGTSLAWTQGGASNLQPVYATAVASLNGKNAVQFDGTDDYFDTNNANAWKFLHDGTGASRFFIWRIDSTGGATMRYGQSQDSSASEIGISESNGAAAVTMRVANGSGTFVNNYTTAPSGHYARDVSRWQMWGYATGTQHSRVSGSLLTNADTGGQSPSSSNPTRTYRLGASASGALPFKGYIAQDIYYDHVLTAGELTSLVNFFAPIYGVSV